MYGNLCVVCRCRAGQTDALLGKDDDSAAHLVMFYMNRLAKKPVLKTGPHHPPRLVLAWFRRCEPWGVVGVWGWAKKPVFNGQKSVFRRAEQPTQSSASIPRLCLFAADRLCTDR